MPQGEPVNVPRAAPEPVSAPQQPQPQAPAEGEDLPNKQNPQRFEYWQSKAQRIENEYNAFKQAHERDAELLPIAEYIRANPQVLDRVEADVRGAPEGSPVQQYAQPYQQPLPLQQYQQPPMIPQGPPPAPPADYDPLDLSDPDSSTFKYEQARHAYQNSMMQFLAWDAQQRAVERQQQQQQRLQQQQRQAQSQFLIHEQGMTPEQAQQFEHWQKTATFQLQDAVDLFRIRHGLQPGPAPPPQQQPYSGFPTPQQLANQALQQPTLMGAAGGVATEPLGDEHQQISNMFRTSASRLYPRPPEGRPRR